MVCVLWGGEILRTVKVQNNTFLWNILTSLSFWSYRKSELRINKASLADSGEYMCKVISKLGNDSASANITIVDANGKWSLLHCVSPSVRGIVIEISGKICDKLMDSFSLWTIKILCVFHEAVFVHEMILTGSMLSFLRWFK